MEPSTMNLIGTIFSGITAIGVIFAGLQVRVAFKTSRENAFLGLLDNWQSKELYSAIRYIHDLRKKWKDIEPDHSKWDQLAKEWVNDHLLQKDDKMKQLELYQRRSVAQFISVMYNLIENNYIKPKNFFEIVPEVRRLIIVLEPIENQLVKYFDDTEVSLANWDRPLTKLAYDRMKVEYDAWFIKYGHRWLHKLDKINKPSQNKRSKIIEHPS